MTDINISSAPHEMLEALRLVCEMVERPPEANCSCHLNPPCSDCVEHSGAREAFALADAVLKKYDGKI